MKGIKIAVPKISPNRQGFISVRFPVEGMTYSQRCFKQTCGKERINICGRRNDKDITHDKTVLLRYVMLRK
jgi:hypothetical protein